MIIVGYRYGQAPESGQSYNTRDNKCEKGVSMASVCGLGESRSFATCEAKENRKKYYYVGTIIGRGGDDEFLMGDVREIKKSEYNDLVISPELVNKRKEIAGNEIKELEWLIGRGYNINQKTIERWRQEL